MSDAKKEKVKVEPGPKQKTWLETATPIEIIIGGQKMYLDPKCFSTGSVGYGLSGKTHLIHGTKETAVDKIQISANFTVIGSKEW